MLFAEPSETGISAVMFIIFKSLARSAMWVVCATLMPLYGMHELTFEHVSLREGLSQSTVHAVYQDQQGFLWFGTADGLNRYDGYRFRVFRAHPNDETSLSDGRISSLGEDPQGHLWVGTFNGLNRMDLGGGTFQRFMADPGDPTSIGGNVINVVLTDSNGVVWIGSYGGGLSRFLGDDRGFETFRFDENKPDGLPTNLINDIVEDSEGFLWLATPEGLVRFDPKNQTVRLWTATPEMGRGPSDTYINVLAMGKPGVLWVGTDNGLDLFDMQAETFVSYQHQPMDPFSLLDSTVHALSFESTGNLWVGTTSGLSWMTGETGRFYNITYNPASKGGFNASSVRSLMRDNQDKLWIGTVQGGLNVLDPNKHRFPRYANDLEKKDLFSGKSVYSFYLDAKKRLWIGTGLGITVRDVRGVDRKLSQKLVQQIGTPRVRSILESEPGTYWVASNGGLFVGSPEEGFRKLDQDPGGTSGKLVFDHLTLSRNNLILASTNKGLLIFNRDGSWIRTLQKQDDGGGLSHNRVTLTLEHPDGRIWVGTTNGLDLYDLNTDEVQRFANQRSNPASLSHGNIQSLAYDPKGRLWVGTSMGLNLLLEDGETFQRYTRDNGLADNWIYGILPMEDDQLWLSSNGGLMHLDTRTGEVLSYNMQDGLQSNEFNRGASFKDPEGRFYFGGISGYNLFNSDTLAHEEVSPSLVISDYRYIAKGRSGSDWFHKPGEQIEFPPGLKSLTISFAALNFNRGGNLYSYRMEGLQDSWIYLGESNDITFNNLGSGDYTFRLRARDRHGHSYEHQAEMQITVKPQIWEQFWVRLLIGAVALGLIYLVILLREKQSKRRNRALVAEVAERTRAEEAARTSERRYRQLTELLPITVYECDLEGKVTFMNPEGLASFRYRFEDIRGKHVLMFVHPSDRERAAENHKLRMSGQPMPHVEYKMVRGDGTTFYAVITATVLPGEDGQKVSALGAVMDVTALKDAERRVLLLNQELESRVEERTQQLEATRHELIASAHKAGMADIATSVLHNIGNILNSVITSGQILQAGFENSRLEKLEMVQRFLRDLANSDGPPDGQKLAKLDAYVGKIRSVLEEKEKEGVQNTHRLMAQIDTIREVIMAQQEYASGTFQSEDLFLERLVEDALHIHQSSLTRRDIAISKNYASLPKVRVHKNKLIHIVINLLKNAADSIGDGPDKRISITIFKEDDHAFIRFTDTGIGIPAENIEKIFNHGFTTKKKGRGFGLHSAASSMAEMGGSMWAESEGHGKGASFILKFPLKAKPRKEQPALATQSD